jgi:membrane-bound metal-dependent hydrolase YbcI (DUF457 family)
MFSNYLLVGALVALGYLSHLVMDGCTNVPLPFMWPVSQRRSWLLPSPLRITTDSWREHMIVLPAVMIAVAAVCVLLVWPSVHQRVPTQLQAQVTSHVGR